MFIVAIFLLSHISVAFRSVMVQFSPFLSTLVHSVNFDSFSPLWYISVHIDSFGLFQSNSVNFHPPWSIWSTLVHFDPLRSIQSNSVWSILVNCGLIGLNLIFFFFSFLGSKIYLYLGQTLQFQEKKCKENKHQKLEI